MLKRFIACFLCLLILSALPVGALAETEPTTPSATETTATETTQATEPTTPEETTPAEPEKKPKVEVDPLGPWGVVTPPHELRSQAARVERLRHAIRWDFQCALEKEEMESLRGYCGLLASYQLYQRGINTWRKSADGKDYFDEYSKMSVTSGGYVPVIYPAKETPEETIPEESVPEQKLPEDNKAGENKTEENKTEENPPKENTLEQILNKITNYGRHEVYNVLVCFERTNTVAGQKYGHVLFVYGIIDGVLYFTEGGNMFGVEGGEPMQCTISQFAASYGTWTEFEGVVVLGCRNYMDNCVSYESDLFATCVSSAPMWAMPYEEQKEQPLRTAMPGERLHVIGLYENREEQYFYQVDDGGTICYVEYQALEPMLFVHENFTLKDPKLPETLTPKKDFTVDGTIEAPGELMSEIQVQILDEAGTVLQRYTTEADGDSFDLGNYRVNQALHFETLAEGAYTYRVMAASEVAYMMAGKLAHHVQFTTLAQCSFCVGAAPRTVQQPEQMPAEPVKDGWIYENGTWYCYEQGAPCTGWVEDRGIRYYLQEDGSVTTGWAVIQEQERLFTATGAMRVGWVSVPDGAKYMDSNGVAVVGWQKVDDERHYFDADGIWHKNHAQTVMKDLSRVSEEVAEDLGVELDKKPFRRDPSKKQPLK